MEENRLILKFLPRFELDLNEILDYITFKLHNPESALKLADKIENSILARLDCPLSFEPFQSNRRRKHPYYRIYVDNFVVYYVVIENVMEVRRILYEGRNAEKIIK
jgi:toxin ParE1/3/4